MKKTIITIAVIVILLLIVMLLGPFYILQEGEQSVVTRFGAIVKVETEPGLKFKMPFVDTVVKYSAKILSWDGDAQRIPTKENQFIYVDPTSRWVISDPKRFYETVKTVENAQLRLDDILDSTVRTVISENYLNEAVRNSNRINQMTVVEDHLAHHKHVQKLYEELLADVPGIHVHAQPTTGEYDSNYWLCTITIDEDVKIKGQENAYKTIVKGAVGGAAGVIHMASSATTDCQPNDNVEALRVLMDQAQIEARPVWKPMHKQPCYKGVPCYLNGVSEAIFKVGMCLPAGPYVTDDDVKYIVETIKSAIIG